MLLSVGARSFTSAHSHQARGIAADPNDPYSRRPVYANGERGPKLDLRAVLADFLVEINLPGMIRAAVNEAMRSAAKPW